MTHKEQYTTEPINEGAPAQHGYNELGRPGTSWSYAQNVASSTATAGWSTINAGDREVVLVQAKEVEAWNIKPERDDAAGKLNNGSAPTQGTPDEPGRPEITWSHAKNIASGAVTTGWSPINAGDREVVLVRHSRAAPRPSHFQYIMRLNTHPFHHIEFGSIRLAVLEWEKSLFVKLKSVVMSPGKNPRPDTAQDWTYLLATCVDVWRSGSLFLLPRGGVLLSGER